MKKMRCGNCGHYKHVLFLTKKNNIVVKCLLCDNKSLIAPIAIPSKVEVKWMNGQKGLLAVF